MIDTLMDAGPLIAIVNRGDPHHTACVEILRAHGGPFYTTLPVMTEAMYLCERYLGWMAQQALWQMERKFGAKAEEEAGAVPHSRYPQAMEKISALHLWRSAWNR